MAIFKEDSSWYPKDMEKFSKKDFDKSSELLLDAVEKVKSIDKDLEFDFESEEESILLPINDFLDSLDSLNIEKVKKEVLKEFSSNQAFKDAIASMKQAQKKSDDLMKAVNDITIKKILVFFAGKKQELKFLNGLKPIPSSEEVKNLSSKLFSIFTDMQQKAKVSVDASLSKFDKLYIEFMNKFNELYKEEEKALGKIFLDEASKVEPIYDELKNKVHDLDNYISLFQAFKAHSENGLPLEQFGDGSYEREYVNKLRIGVKAESMNEKYLTHYYNSPAYPYLSSVKYDDEKVLTERKNGKVEPKKASSGKKIKKKIAENYNSAAIQHWYYHSPAYPYQSSCKYPKKDIVSDALSVSDKDFEELLNSI